MTHCSQCGDTWSSPSAVHCTGCHRLFKSQNASNHHRENGVCLEPENLVFKGGKRIGEKKLASSLNYYGTIVWSSTVPVDLPPHWNATK